MQRVRRPGNAKLEEIFGGVCGSKERGACSRNVSTNHNRNFCIKLCSSCLASVRLHLVVRESSSSNIIDIQHQRVVYKSKSKMPSSTSVGNVGAAAD
jgi:hypothetical protein